MSSVPIFSRGIHGSDNRHKQDYYKVLGVNKNADAKDIKKAYYQVRPNKKNKCVSGNRSESFRKGRAGI